MVHYIQGHTVMQGKMRHGIIESTENHINVAFFCIDLSLELDKIQTNQAIPKIQKRHWFTSVLSSIPF